MNFDWLCSRQKDQMKVISTKNLENKGWPQRVRDTEERMVLVVKIN